MTPEEKVIEKIRKILIADSTIFGYVKNRVYLAHISSITEPIYPAISLHISAADVDYSAPDVVRVGVQIDAWMPSNQYDGADLLTIARRVRALLHRKDLIDTDIGLNSGEMVERGSGPVMYENDTSLYHYPQQYTVRGI